MRTGSRTGHSVRRVGRIILRCQSRPQGAFGTARRRPSGRRRPYHPPDADPASACPPAGHLRPRWRGLPRAGGDPRRRRAGVRSPRRGGGDALRHQQLDGDPQRLCRAPGRAWHRRQARRDRHQHLGDDHPPAGARAGPAAPAGGGRGWDARRAARRRVRRDLRGRRRRSGLERRPAGRRLRRGGGGPRPGGDVSDAGDRGGSDPRRRAVRGHQRRPALPDAGRPHAGCRGDRGGAAGHHRAAAAGDRQAGAGHVPGHPGG